MAPGQAEGKKNRIKVLILAGSDPVGDWMAEIINGQEDMAFLGMLRDLMQALDSVEKLEPDIVLVDVSSGILQQGDLLTRLSAPATGAAVIAPPPAMDPNDCQRVGGFMRSLAFSAFRDTCSRASS